MGEDCTRACAAAKPYPSIRASPILAIVSLPALLSGIAACRACADEAFDLWPGAGTAGA